MHHPMTPWVYPGGRYYYAWYGEGQPVRTDGDIKADLVDRLRRNPHTRDDYIEVNVEHNVAILTGEVGSTLTKRAAGDDAWDTAGVTDVSNQLKVRGA